MPRSQTLGQEIADLIEKRSPPDIQNDVLDVQAPSLEGENDKSLHQDEIERVDALQALRELQAGDPIRWKLWRVGDMDEKRNGYLAEWGTSQLTQENIKNHFGGGSYRIKGTFTDGSYAGQRTVRIAGDAKVDTMQQANGSSFNMAEWLAMQQQMEERREAREAERRRESESRMERLMGIFAPVLGTVVTAIMGRAAPVAPDVAGLITALRPSIAPPDPAAQMKTTLETMVMMKKVMGDGGSDDSLSGIAAALAPYAGPVLTALASRPQPAMPVRKRLPAPGAQPTPPPAAPVQVVQVQTPVVKPATAPGLPAHTGVNLEAPSQPMTEQDRTMFAQLKPQVDALVTMAQQGADPIECANVFFETTMRNVDDSTYDKLCQFFDNPKAVDQISIFNTGVKDQRPFFEGFQKRMLEWIVSEDQAAQSPIVSG